MQISKANYFLFIIVLVLISGIPFFIGFSPYIDSFSKHACIYEFPPSADRIYIERLIIIISGLFLTVLALTIVIINLMKGESLNGQQLLSITLVLIIFHLGWKNYPFLANGLHNAQYSIESGHYDPKALLPNTIFLGSAWYLGILTFYLFTAFSPIVLLFLFLMKKIPPKKFLVIMLIQFLNISLFSLTPCYLTWLLD